MNRKIIFITFIVVVVLVLGYSLLWIKSSFIDYRPQTQHSTSTQTPTQAPVQPSITPVPKSSLTDKTANWKTYRNDQYGFEFRYPSDYSLEVFKDGKGSDWQFWLTSPTKEILSMKRESNSFPIRDTFDPKLDIFENFVLDRLRGYCSADNDALSLYCSGEIKKSEFTNPAGIVGYEIYLGATIENHLTNQKTAKIIGPIFVLDFSPLNNSDARGMFLDTRGTFPDSEEKEIIVQIVSTFKFTR